VEFYCDNALAKSTKQTYKSAKRWYLAFCSLHDIAPIPTSEGVLCRYVAYLANEGLTHSTIRGYLSAVRHLHIEEDRGDPNISGMAKLELKGVKMVQATKHQPRVRHPITPQLLQIMRGACSQLWNPRGPRTEGCYGQQPPSASLGS
jgi:hypothetical protein